MFLHHLHSWTYHSLITPSNSQIWVKQETFQSPSQTMGLHWDCYEKCGRDTTVPLGPEVFSQALLCCHRLAYDVSYFNNLNSQSTWGKAALLLETGLSWLTPCAFKSAYSLILKTGNAVALKKVLSGWWGNINHTLINHATGHAIIHWDKYIKEMVYRSTETH